MGLSKFLLLAFSLALAIELSKGFDFSDKDIESDKGLWDLYERWRSHHTISRDFEDKHKRFNVFKENVKYISKVNKMNKSYKLKLNKFSDLTNHEFRNLYAGSKIKHHRMFKGTRDIRSFVYKNVRDVPVSVDWRAKGAVTPVKNQGQCGSCWAFSTVVAVEGVNQIKTNKLVSLSEQELVNCDNTNYGCNGGLMESAFEWIKEKGGLTTEQSYPYTGEAGTCGDDTVNSVMVSIDGHEAVPQNDEDSLMKAVANQPVSVAIEASGQDFQFYAEGVFTGQCGTELDHGVAVVGYGETSDGIKYWIVKNSWGADWGEEGYMRMERNISAKEGLCGIAMEASYPVKNPMTNPGDDGSYQKDEL